MKNRNETLSVRRIVCIQFPSSTESKATIRSKSGISFLWIVVLCGQILNAAKDVHYCKENSWHLRFNDNVMYGYSWLCSQSQQQQQMQWIFQQLFRMTESKHLNPWTLIQFHFVDFSPEFIISANCTAMKSIDIIKQQQQQKKMSQSMKIVCEKFFHRLFWIWISTAKLNNTFYRQMNWKFIIMNRIDSRVELT